MSELSELLSSGFDIEQTLNSNLMIAESEVSSIPRETFLANSNEQIIEHIFSKRQVIPPQLCENQMVMEELEHEIDVSNDPNRDIRIRGLPFFVPGLKIIITIPFSGNTVQWRYKQSGNSKYLPHASIRPFIDKDGGNIEIFFHQPTDMLDRNIIQRQLDKAIADIKEHFQYIKEEIKKHNVMLSSEIRRNVQQRRKSLEKHEDIINALKIPLKKKHGAPDISELPIKRKLIRPLPTHTQTPSEPGIKDADYDHILKVIRHEGKSFEATPKTFVQHNEEQLRDIILAHLNGHYEGQATGETFRKSGKTDIRIEDENRAAFIAECKIWDGSSEASKAIDQLLGYLTWRDCKTALVVFNTNRAGFSEIQKKLPLAIQRHPNFINEISVNEVGEWRFRMKSKEDEERVVIVHVFLFNLYCK